MALVQTTPNYTISLRQKPSGERHDANHGTSEVVQLEDGTLALQPSAPHGTEQSLGLLHIDASSILFEAVVDKVMVSSSSSGMSKSQTGFFNRVWLKPRRPDGSSTIVLLRPGDTILFPSLKIQLIVEVRVNDVQVDSSLPLETVTGSTPERTEQHALVNAAASNAEYGTADQHGQVISSRALVRTSTNLSRSTPLPSAVESQVVQETPTTGGRHSDDRQMASALANPLTDRAPDAENSEAETTPEEPPDTRAFLSRASSMLSDALKNAHKNGSRSDQDQEGARNASVTADSLFGDGSVRIGPDHEIPPQADGHTSGDDDTTPEESYRTAQNHLVHEASAEAVGVSSDGAGQDQDEDSDEDVVIPARKKAKRDKVESQDRLRSNVMVEIYRRPASTAYVKPKPQGRTLSDISEASGLVSTNADQRTPLSAASDKSLNKSPAGARYSGPPPRVVFSNSTLPERTGIMKVFKEQGGSHVNTATETGYDFLCVGSGKLAKTGKLLLSVAYGKQIIKDRWIANSVSAGHLLDPQDFLPDDPEREEEWGCRINDAVGTGRRDLLAEKTIYITPALKKDYGSGYKEIEQLAKVAGAKKVFSKPARDAKPDDSDTIILALENGDLDAVKLYEEGHACFHRDLLSISILRGRLDLESDEFLIRPSSSQSKKTPKRKRTS